MSDDNNSIAKPILALLSIALLLMPAITIHLIDEFQLDKLEIVIGDQGISAIQSGNFITTVEPDKFASAPEIDDLLDNLGYPPLAPRPLPALDKNTLLLRFSGFKSAIWNYTKAAGDINTYVTTTYDVGGFGNADTSFSLMNFTTHNLTNYNALIFTTTATHGEFGLFFNNNDFFFAWLTVNFYGLGENGSFVMPISQELKLHLLSEPDQRIWTYFNLLNYSQLAFTFSIELADTSGIFSIEPLTQIVIILAFVLFIMSVFTFFTLDGADITLGQKARENN